MEINRSYASLYFCLALMLAAGCGSPAAPQVDNPVADALRAQARELNQETQACQEGIAVYRAQARARMASDGCDSIGFEQIRLSNSSTVSQCVSETLAAVPACRRWADSYQAMVAADAGGVRAQEETVEMEGEITGPEPPK